MATKQAQAQQGTLGANIKYRVEGGKLVLEIDMNKEQGASKSGKSVIIASTNGNAAVGTTGLTLGLNLYRKN